MKRLILKETFIFSATAIFAPILFFGGIGYILDRHFYTDKTFLLLSVGLAFLCTQFMMLRKVKQFSKATLITSPVGETGQDNSKPVNTKDE